MLLELTVLVSMLMLTDFDEVYNCKVCIVTDVREHYSNLLKVRIDLDLVVVTIYYLVGPHMDHIEVACHHINFIIDQIPQVH